MYTIAIHQISDPEKFWAGAAEMQLPDGLTLHTVAPNQDGTRAVCFWEADSIDSVRDFVESNVGDISTNEYFEVNDQTAMGLPTNAAAAAAR
jgi:hypothetical protein